jgi:hypothetical protein
MSSRVLAVLAVLCVGAAMGCDDDGGGQVPADFTPGPGGDGQVPGGEGQVPADFTPGPGGDGQVPADFTPGPGGDGQVPADFTPGPGADAGAGVYGKICTDSTQCGANELCVKLASDSYSKTGPPPPKGLCLKKCTNTTAPCSSSATHFHPCIGASTWDLGALTVCAIACYTNFGTAKTYACPPSTYCSRSIGSVMKVCTPYP